MATSQQKPSKPLPRPANPTLSKPFWESAKKHELIIQRCKACFNSYFYPREACPTCLSPEYEWIKASGKGVVYSFTVIHQPAHPAFQDEVPYVNAIVQLAEGPRMVSNVIGIDPHEVKIGMPVEVVFEDVSPEYSLYKFKPVG